MKPVWLRNRTRHEVPPPRRWRMRLWLAVAGYIIICFSKDEGWVSGLGLLVLAGLLCLISPPADHGIRKVDDRQTADEERYETE